MPTVNVEDKTKAFTLIELLNILWDDRYVAGENVYVIVHMKWIERFLVLVIFMVNGYSQSSICMSEIYSSYLTYVHLCDYDTNITTIVILTVYVNLYEDHWDTTHANMIIYPFHHWKSILGGFFLISFNEPCFRINKSETDEIVYMYEKRYSLSLFS